MPKRELTPTQETRLLQKYASGDFGPGKWESVKVLINKGYLNYSMDQKRIEVTHKGKEYCDAFHTSISL